MSVPSALNVFVLGSFRDLRPGGTESLALLRRLVGALRDAGWDAFLSGDARSLEIAGGPLAPRRMTEVLEQRCDLAIFVGARDGRGDGWVSELTAMQVRNPAGSRRRVLLLEAGYPLTSILDPAQEGYLADPPVMVGLWGDEAELHMMAGECASHFARYGQLPPVL